MNEDVILLVILQVVNIVVQGHILPVVVSTFRLEKSLVRLSHKYSKFVDTVKRSNVMIAPYCRWGPRNA